MVGGIIEAPVILKKPFRERDLIVATYYETVGEKFWMEHPRWWDRVLAYVLHDCDVCGEVIHDYFVADACCEYCGRCMCFGCFSVAAWDDYDQECCHECYVKCVLTITERLQPLEPCN